MTHLKVFQWHWQELIFFNYFHCIFKVIIYKELKQICSMKHSDNHYINLLHNCDIYCNHEVHIDTHRAIQPGP